MKKLINWFKKVCVGINQNNYDLSGYSIQELKSMGFECKVFHSRFSNDGFEIARNEKHQSRRFNYLTDRTQCKPSNFFGRGGRTEIELENTCGFLDDFPKFIKYKGISYCSLEDNFCKKDGIRIALSKLQKVN